MPFRELLRAQPGIPRVAPSMAFSLRERFFQNGGGSQVSDSYTYTFRNFSLTLLKFPRVIFKSVIYFPTGSVSVLFSPLFCQSDHPDCLVQPPNFWIAPKLTGEGASSLFGGWPGSLEMSLAPVQPRTCTGATPRLHRCKRHFRDSRAILRKDYLLLLLSI